MMLSRIHDPGAVGIADEIVVLLTLCRQLLVTTTLSAIDAGIECRREIRVITGESYAKRVLEHLMAEYMLENGDNP
ncbi:hypothetical protein ACEPWQ_25745 (plasmid) [Leclercia adecarboxylata]|uniref:hypothetical protein n=1 Tax=Leclercia adecarboxylata TaxID=83655 RepID=UPI0030CD6704